jgi:DMSO reductase anchor subunit
MHPALSIIFFTTFSGAGYGLAAILGLGFLPATMPVALLGYGLALAMIVGGLLSSTAHLGHPERAWRALSQWRSSWLSREGVLALVTFVPICVAAFGAVAFAEFWPTVGVITGLMCMATVFATSMIYTSLKTVGHWHTPLTPAVFLTFAVSSGLVGASVVAAVAGGDAGQSLYFPSGLAVAGAWMIKAAWWSRAGSTGAGSTISSATGLGALGEVRHLEAPHSNENYLTSEMGFRIARKHAVKLRRIAVVIGGLVPVLILAVVPILPGFLSAVLTSVALFSHLAGILVERWLFFAEARHTVMLYYGASAA